MKTKRRKDNPRRERPKNGAYLRSGSILKRTRLAECLSGEHDVDHMTKQRKDPVIQEQAMIFQSPPSHAAGGVRWRGGRRVAVRRQEQLGVSSSGAKNTPQGLAMGYNREQRPGPALDVLAAGTAQAWEEHKTPR